MRTSVTIPDEIYKTGLENAKKRGFANSFSAYLAWLIERDTSGAVSREEIPRNAEPSEGKILSLRAAKESPDSTAT